MRRQHCMAIYPCRLRKYRKSAHLTQRELAILVGLGSQGALSGIEAGLKRPGTRIAISCELLFGVSMRELFPGLYSKFERDVLASAQRLHARLEIMEAHSATRANLAAHISRLGGASPTV